MQAGNDRKERDSQNRGLRQTQSSGDKGKSMVTKWGRTKCPKTLLIQMKLICFLSLKKYPKSVFYHILPLLLQYYKSWQRTECVDENELCPEANRQDPHPLYASSKVFPTHSPSSCPPGTAAYLYDGHWVTGQSCMGTWGHVFQANICTRNMMSCLSSN